MAFEIRPLLSDDVVEFAELDAAAMEDWAVAQAMELEAAKKGRTRCEMITEWVKRNLASPDPNNIWIKAYDTATGEMVAGANWILELEPKKSEPKDDVPAPVEVEGTEPKRDPPSMFSEMRRSWESSKEKYIGQQPYCHLRVLVTHPKHQRKGAGNMLVRWGCDRADEAGVISTLQSSPAGLRLYLKLGFEVVEEGEFDLRPFGLQVIETSRFMIRQPQSKQS